MYKKLLFSAALAAAVAAPAALQAQEPTQPPVPTEQKLETSFSALQKSIARSIPGKVGLAITPIG